MTDEEITYLIDTNVILRYLLNDHPEQSQKAKSFMMHVYEDKVKAEIPDVVITECVYVMQKLYHIPRKEIGASLKKMLAFQDIKNINRSQILNALIKYEESNIDIPDCILAAYSSPKKIVISFDKDMEKLKAYYEILENA